MSEHSPSPATDHADHAHDISKHVRAYWMVGGVLIACTALTVALSYVDFGTAKANMAIGMIVATIKAGMVAAIFMHLKSEKSMIYKFLIFTVIFVLGLVFFTLLHWADPIPGTNHWKL